MTTKTLMASVDSESLLDAAVEEMWMGMYRKAKKFRKTHNHWQVPAASAKEELVDLRRWIHGQAILESIGRLPQHHRAKLDQLGFPWRPPTKMPPKRQRGRRDDAAWYAKYYRLVVFYMNEGHANMSVSGCRRHEPALGTWISNHRSWYQQGRVPDDRKVLLDEIGFEWRRKDRHKQNDKQANQESIICASDDDDDDEEEEEDDDDDDEDDDDCEYDSEPNDNYLADANEAKYDEHESPRSSARASAHSQAQTAPSTSSRRGHGYGVLAHAKAHRTNRKRSSHHDDDEAGADDRAEDDKHDADNDHGAIDDDHVGVIFTKDGEFVLRAVYEQDVDDLQDKLNKYKRMCRRYKEERDAGAHHHEKYLNMKGLAMRYKREAEEHASELARLS